MYKQEKYSKIICILLGPIFTIICGKPIAVFKNRSRRARVDQNDIKIVFCSS